MAEKVQMHILIDESLKVQAQATAALLQMHYQDFVAHALANTLQRMAEAGIPIAPPPELPGASE